MVKTEWNLSPIGSSQSSNWPAVVVINDLPENTRMNNPRKRRPRVKELEAIYDSEGPPLHSKFQQQTSDVGRLFNGKKVKCENYDNKESKVSDGPSIEGMPLMDIQARVKGKRQRFSSVTFPEADLKNGKIDIKIKLENEEEENADLEQPLISLVSKLAKKKRRKLAQAGQSIHEGSTTGWTSAKSAVVQPELTSSADTTEDKCGTALKKFCMDINDSSISPATDIKSEKVSSFSMNELISKDAVTPVPDLVEKYDFLCCSFSEPLQKACEVRFESSESKCGTDMVLHSGVEGHMEGSLVCANTVSIVVNGNLIAESEHSGNPSAEELESVGCCERQSTKLNHNIGPSLHGHVDEIPIEGMGLYKLTSTPECGEDCIGEMVKMYNSATASHQASSLPVSPLCMINSSCATSFVPLSRGMELGSDVSNKKSNSAAELYYDGKSLSNVADSEFQKKSNCYQTNDGAFDHIVLYSEETDSGATSNSSMEVECLTDLVQKAAADVMIDSLPVEGSSSKTEKLSSLKPLLNGYTGNEICSSNEIPKSVDSEESAKTLHVDCQISPCSDIAVNGLLHPSNHFCNGSAADEKLVAAAGNPISYSTDTEGHYPIKGSVAGLKTYIPPRKILSNRKTFSPDSQEKLRHALNNDFDTLKNSELVTKKPTARGVLKSSDACASSGNDRTQEIIEFSMRQVKDFRAVASRLLRGIKSLKNITEETRCTEICPLAVPKFTAEEVRMAIEEASRLEPFTKNWLSMMTKDCNRFCKILRTTEKPAAANGTCRETKKVTFADVAVGTLSQVRVYDDQQPPVAVSESYQASL